MINHHVVVFLYRNVTALFCAASIGISPSSPPLSNDAHTHSSTAAAYSVIQESKVSDSRNNTDILIKTQLWQYLRTGLNYLEASGKEVPANFKHPGGKAYGPLALTAISIKDVKNHYPLLSHYSTKKVLSNPVIYEKFASIYADLLLNHYLKLDYFKMPKEEVFCILEKAWFLGPTLYQKGRPVIYSREAKANEYIIALTVPLL